MSTVPVPAQPCGKATETDDTDAVAQSLNSTVESFSEHAWDNYQVTTQSVYNVIYDVDL